MKERIKIVLPTEEFYKENKVEDIVKESLSKNMNVVKLEINKVRDNIFDLSLEFKNNQDDIKVKSLISNHTDVEYLEFVQD